MLKQGSLSAKVTFIRKHKVHIQKKLSLEWGLYGSAKTAYAKSLDAQDTESRSFWPALRDRGKKQK